MNPTLSDAISDLLMANGTSESEDSKVFCRRIFEYCQFISALYEGRVCQRQSDSHRFAKHKLETTERMAYILDHSSRNKDVDKLIRAKYKITKHRLIPLLAAEDQCQALAAIPTIAFTTRSLDIDRPRIRKSTKLSDWYEFREIYDWW